MVKFLNDTELVNALEFDAFAELQKRAKGSNTPPKGSNNPPYIENALDFLPLPTVGIALLKERRLKTLYCSKQAIEFVSFIAESNCISLDSIVFIDDPHDTLFINDKFDLIILPLIDSLGKNKNNFRTSLISHNELKPLGTLNSMHAANYTILKENKLTKNGFMVPEQIEVMFNIIESAYLRNVTRIIEREIVDRLQIGSLMNEYATTLHLDIGEEFSNSVSCKTLYEANRMANVQLNDRYYELENKIYIPEEKCTGVLFWFNINLTASSKNFISTKRKNSFAKLGCFINENDKRHEGFITLSYRQNSGVMKIDFK